MSDSANEHRRASEVLGAIPVAILTVSDTRTQDNDESGKLIGALLSEKGQVVHSYEIIKDEPALVSAFIDRLASEKKVRVLLITGGTGMSRRDGTFEVLEKKFEKTLPGFGELFRSLSYAEIGAAAMLSRATAGLVQGLAVFSMPGSAHAVRLAMEKLILPELAHLVREIQK
ncbi:MAG: MogA/MoaB family molybdenum cofactor biosynthesis protein [Spirochaetia bacterium]|nr:MogA/MoaB family molybdenum cofactor biosynthesis protein [Spirochaetia bacterium]